MTMTMTKTTATLASAIREAERAFMRDFANRLLDHAELIDDPTSQFVGPIDEVLTHLRTLGDEACMLRHRFDALTPRWRSSGDEGIATLVARERHFAAHKAMLRARDAHDIAVASGDLAASEVTGAVLRRMIAHAEQQRAAFFDHLRAEEARMDAAVFPGDFPGLCAAELALSRYMLAGEPRECGEQLMALFMYAEDKAYRAAEWAVMYRRWLIALDASFVSELDDYEF